ncbi:MAG: UDP-N-acetylmuramate dehydrogenase [Chloroflexota bacterium]
MPLDPLCSVFCSRLQTDVSLARYTTARLGGPADALLVAESVDELADTASQLWNLDIPFVILGGGSNVLISDAGIREVVILNRAKEVHIDGQASPPTVWAGAGANFGSMARQAASLGLGGMEWAAGIPGTVGGAVFSNAGAHGGDVAVSLLMVEILPRDGRREQWPVEKMGYTYRSSILKRKPGDVVVGKMLPQDWGPGGVPSILKRKPGDVVILSAKFRLEHSNLQAVQEKLDEFSARRHSTQPPGASMGSIFKNPPGDYAGRLIEAAGLKGTRIGGAEISPKHANFFVNHGGCTAAEIFALIQLARDTVFEKFGVKLECEVELIGEW